jgi:hypothetical protein
MMKKFLLLNLLLLLITINLLNAQVRRIVLLEEATNTSCPPCAENNPKLQAYYKSHFGGVISVRYHAWWPGENDPMYLHNPAESRNRIRNYYGIFGVPNYYLDGFDYGEPLDSLAMLNQMNYLISKGSPVKIKIDADIDEDSVRASIKLIGVSPVLQTNLKLRAAVIERLVKYSSPPGNNGEKVFPDVMRKMLPDTNGYAINCINPGEELIYYVSCPVNNAWKWNDLAVVAWLQADENQPASFPPSTANNTVIQSNISIPTFIIESDKPLAEFLSLHQNVSKNLKIINDNNKDLHLRLKITEANVPAGWNYSFTYNNTIFDSVDVTISPDDSITFVLNVNIGAENGIIKLSIFAQNLEDPYRYGYTAHYVGVTKTENSNVLFIDDDGGSNMEAAFLPLLDSAGIRYECVEKQLISTLNQQVSPENFKAVFWNVREESQRFSQLDIALLEDYLNSGGNLFLSVTDPYIFRTFSWFFVIWNYPVLNFCHNYLDAEFYDVLSSNSLLNGIPGTLGEGINSNLDNGTHIMLGSYSGASDTILQYTGTSSYAGLSYSNGTYRAVFLGVGLEQFKAASARQQLIQKIRDWFEVPVGIANEKSDVLAEFKLEQNYPNPFNPTTNFEFRIADFVLVSLKIYDVLGREVTTLIDEEKPVGVYKIKWNAEGFSSGVYFYQLKAGNYIETKKMLLVK